MANEKQAGRPRVNTDKRFKTRVQIQGKSVFIKTETSSYIDSAKVIAALLGYTGDFNRFTRDVFDAGIRQLIGKHARPGDIEVIAARLKEMDKS